MLKVTGADVPPALVTVMLAVPTVVTRLAGTVASSMAPPTDVVTSGVVPQLMVVVEAKCVPTTLNRKAALPAVT
jgi:hypothetical protein